MSSTAVVRWASLSDSRLRDGLVAFVLELQLHQQELVTYLDQQLPDERNQAIAQKRLSDKLAHRTTAVDDMQKALDQVDYLASLDAQNYSEIRNQLNGVRDAIIANARLYSILLAHPPIGKRSPDLDDTAREAFDTRDAIKVAEGRIKGRTSVLADTLKKRTLDTMGFLEHNEHTLRQRTTYLGLLAVALGLLVTVWVVITLRPLRQLRLGARRDGSGDYATRIDETGPTEVAELARELNRMARAIQERERELVRSGAACRGRQDGRDDHARGP